MTDSVLYIIGNGFDLYHGVKSSYGSFRKWLQTHDYDTYQTYETVCDYDALWSDFETGMAYVSRDVFLESGLAFFPDSKSDPNEWSAADILLGGDAASSSAYELLDKLKKDFHKWVCSLSVPRDYKDKMLYVDDYARFLTFNYTTFLESHYGIPSSQIIIFTVLKPNHGEALWLGMGKILLRYLILGGKARGTINLGIIKKEKSTISVMLYIGCIGGIRNTCRKMRL